MSGSIELKNAVAKKFYHVDKYQDYALDGGESTFERIVGIYELQRDDGKTVSFAVFFNVQGHPLSLTGAFEEVDESCLPYFFYPLGTVAIRYHAQSKSTDLWQLRTEMMKALQKLLGGSNLSNGQESVTVMLRASTHPTERQQTIQLVKAKEFYEQEIIEAAKKLSVPGVSSIDGGVARSGNPLSGFLGPNSGATCTEM